jgi:hypothetical protein
LPLSIHFYQLYQTLVQKDAIFHLLQNKFFTKREEVVIIVHSCFGRESMAEERSYPETREPEPECGPPDDESSPLPEDWQEATLRRLEAWIAERESLIAELERRIEAIEAETSPA